MRKVIFPLAFIGATSLIACSFEMHTGKKDPNAPPPPPPGQTVAPPATTVTPAATPTNTGPIHRLGRRPMPTPTSTSTVAPTPTAAPTGAPVITGTTIFGSGTATATSFKGNIYFIAAGATKIPALASLTPNGFLFTPTINVPAQAFSGGFPGVDATRTQNFAIRFEAPLVVTTEADVDFRVVSDDGAILMIDQTPIVDNDGARAAPAEKTGPVHLVAGTHILTVDYLQTTGNVALQVYCKKANAAEVICPTQL